MREAAKVVLPDAAFRVLDMAILSLDIRAAHVLGHAATFAQSMGASDVQAWCDHLKEHQNGGSE